MGRKKAAERAQDAPESPKVCCGYPGIIWSEVSCLCSCHFVGGTIECDLTKPPKKSAPDPLTESEAVL